MGSPMEPSRPRTVESPTRIDEEARKVGLFHVKRDRAAGLTPGRSSGAEDWVLGEAADWTAESSSAFLRARHAVLPQGWPLAAPQTEPNDLGSASGTDDARGLGAPHENGMMARLPKAPRIRSRLPSSNMAAAGMVSGPALAPGSRCRSRRTRLPRCPLFCRVPEGSRRRQVLEGSTRRSMAAALARRFRWNGF
jgi:hypothetical protein